ncbi:MAG: putative Ig domain-containing protein, partial [Planctomycetota bacterium]
PLFLVRAIDRAGNVERVPDGIRVPRLVPQINLGSAPSVNVTPPIVAPRAEAQPETVADRYFDEGAFGIPARTSATQPSAFPRVIRPLAAERFADIPGNSGAGIGALAMTVAPDGSILVSGGAGRNELFRIDPSSGQTSSLASGVRSPIYDLAFDASGQLWASTGGEGLLQLDPTTGAVLDTIGAGISLGLAAVPGETLLYVATTSGISQLDTATRQLIPFSDTRVDSMAVAEDGTLYGTAWPSGGEVLRFDFRGRAEIVAEVEGGAESIAFGGADSIFAGALLVGHESSGQITVLDPVSLRQSIAATGGDGRVEGIQALGGGRFLATQGDQIDLFVTVAAPQVIETRIVDGANRAELVFDVSLQRDVAAARGGDNPANYSLRNRETGETINIGAVDYQDQNRSTQLLFEALPPAEYELTVSSSVESEQGIPIGGDGFTTTFRVFEDVSISTTVSYSNTRLNRVDGTLLFDVVVHNTADFDIAGPINVVFDQLGDSSVIFFGNDGAPADANGYQVLGDGTVLSGGGSSEPQTITIANPNLLDLDFVPRVLATLPPNELPNFNSDPTLAASVGSEYQYIAEADDPDGNTISYVLAEAPEGATVDATTGEIDWMPTRATTDQATFELRAYDARGAYRRQTWVVDVSGANQAPVLATIDNFVATEGDLIEIPVSGFDPDGDDLFYFADNLPAGAIFDPIGQALRWRPGGDDAGVYDRVTISTSDGFIETSVSFQIVIANNNVAPTLAPVASRTINEGDAITFTLFGEDEDGDTLRYLSTTLPPGSILDPNTGVFEWTPGFDQSGVYELALIADDGTTQTRETTTLTVNNLNGPVRFPTIDAVEIFEGQTFALRVAAFDPEFPVAPVDPTSVTEDFFIDFEGLLPQLTYNVTGLPSGAEFDATRQLLTWTPGFDDAGIYDVTFEAMDDGDGTGTPSMDSVTVSITVADANFRPEVAEIAGQSVAVGEMLEIPITASDFEGTPLSLGVQFDQSTRLPSFASFVDNGDGTGLLSLSPTPGDRGDFLVTVTASETQGDTPLVGETPFTLQVTSENEPPRFDPFFDSVLLVDSPFSLDLLIDDDDQDALDVTAIGLPAGSTLVDTGVYGRHRFDWTPTSLDLGTHTITFEVTDSGNGVGANKLTDSRTITLTVRDTNTRPDLEPIGAQTVQEGDELVFTVSASDADGDTVSFAAELVSGGVLGSLPSGAEFDPSSGVFAWTPSQTQAGVYQIRVTATDGAGARSEDVLVTVSNRNQPPTFSTLPQLFTREGDQLVFSLSAGDPDGETLVYGFEGTPPSGFEFNPESRTVIWEVDFDSAGDYTLPFSVTDPSGATDSLEVDVRVFGTNRAPVIEARQVRNAEIGTLLEVPIAVSDPDGDAVTLTAIDLPDGATLDGDNVIRWTAASFQAGVFTVRLTADDGDLRTEQPINLIASLDPAGPQVRIVKTPSFAGTPGQPILLEPIAESDVTIVSTVLSIDGVEFPLDALGQATFTSAAPGRFEATAVVTDIEGRETTVTVPLFVRDPGDFDAPRIDVMQLAPPEFTEPRDLIVDISDTGLAEYAIELIPRGGGAALPIAAGSTSITRNVTVDPARFANGFYTLRVTASDFGGLASEFTHDIEINSVDKSGAFFQSTPIMTVTLDGVVLPIERVHDSLVMTSGNSSLGTSWSLPLLEPQLAVDVGDDSGDAFAAMTDRGRVYVTVPSGQRIGFSFRPVETTSGSLETFAPAWAADPGVDWALESFEANLRRAGDGYFVVGSGLPYTSALAEPGETAFTLVSPTGMRHELTEQEPGAFKLRKISTPDGSTSLRVTDSTIVAPSGDRVTFVRDSRGRISELVGPGGEHVIHQFDDSGRLTIEIDAANGTREFYGYDAESRLTTIAPSAGPGALIEYDGDGAVSAIGEVRLFLGGTEALLTNSIDATLGESADEFAFTITEGELRTSPGVGVTLGVSVVGATGEIVGLSAGTDSVIGATTTRTYTVTEPGTYRVAVSGSSNQSYSLNLFVVGDVNVDGNVDAADRALFNAAAGNASGESGYVLEADFDRDGTIGPIDRGAFQSMFGFVANQAPMQTAVSLDQTSVGSTLRFGIEQFASDPEADRVLAIAPSVTGGSLRILGGGLYEVTFDPAATVSTVSLTPADPVVDATRADLELNPLGSQLVGLRIEEPSIEFRTGDRQQLAVSGELSDGNLVPIDPREVVFTSLDPNVAEVFDNGLVRGGDRGETAIVASAFGFQTAIGVRNSLVNYETIDVYPSDYVLLPGETRQFLVRRREPLAITDVADDPGTRYVVENPAILSVSETGLLEAVGMGTTEVIVIRDGQHYVTTFVVDELESQSTAEIGAEGGLFGTVDGPQVGIPEGALSEPATISVSTLDVADLPYELPPGFEFATGLEITGIPEENEAAWRVSLPVASQSEGDVVYLVTPLEVIREGETTPELTWMLVDSMVVGSDGRARTTSPPNIGVAARRPVLGNTFQATSAGIMFAINPTLGTSQTAIQDLDGRLNTRGNPQLGDYISSIETDRNGSQGGSAAIYASHDAYGFWEVPLPYSIPYQLTTYSTSPQGLREVDSRDVSIGSGVAPPVFLPAAPRATATPFAPVLATGQVRFLPTGTTVELLGTNFVGENPFAGVPNSGTGTLGSRVEDLYVTIEVGGRDTFDTDGT